MIKDIIISILLCLTVASASATKSGQGIEIENAKVEKNGEQLRVRFTVEVPKNAVNRNYKLTMLPVISKDGLSKELTPIVVESRRSKMIDYRNRVALDTNVIRTGGGNTVEYEATIPYQQWMNGSMLRIDRKQTGCCTEQLQQPEILAANMVFVQPIVAHIEEVYVPSAGDQSKMIVPKARQAERRWEFSKSDMIVDYEVAKTEINPSLYDNRQMLTELADAIRKRYTGKQESIKEIEITGYSSPEGTLEFNSRLAIERAVSLKDYLQREVTGLPDSLFKLENGGENWDGLRKLVEQSDMPHRSEVLRIIDNVPAEVNLKTNTSRKRSLMDLNGGRTWNDMLKNFFPQLRNACYVVVDQDQLADVQADEINRALLLMHNKEYDKALPILLAVRDDARAWNPIGVCYMMTGRPVEAKQYLEKAAANGSEQAKRNLNAIQD